jgi:lysozyme family protein
MTDLVALRATNAKRWANAKPTRAAQAVSVAKRLVAAKARYQEVERRTGVPWWFIACVHEREASQNFNTQLGQGDPLHSVSVHVPAGRGPFNTWEDGAVDALVNCGPFAARNKDWSLGGSLAMWEMYNGLKYFTAGRPSPYVFSGTSIYDPPSGPGGKVIRDHGPIEDVVDKQLGCAAMLMAMMALDPSIKFGASTTKKAGGAIVAGGGAATAAHQAGLGIGWIIAIAAAVALTVFLAWKLKK